MAKVKDAQDMVNKSLVGQYLKNWECIWYVESSRKTTFNRTRYNLVNLLEGNKKEATLRQLSKMATLNYDQKIEFIQSLRKKQNDLGDHLTILDR